MGGQAFQNRLVELFAMEALVELVVFKIGLFISFGLMLFLILDHVTKYKK